jgi:hypothetical protein
MTQTRVWASASTEIFEIQTAAFKNSRSGAIENRLAFGERDGAGKALEPVRSGCPREPLEALGEFARKNPKLLVCVWATVGSMNDWGSRFGRAWRRVRSVKRWFDW